MPVDRKLALPADDRVSPGLALWSTRVGASLPYEPARRFFRDLTGQDVISAQAIHDQVADVGQSLPEMNVVPAATTPGDLPAQVALDTDGAVVGMHHSAKPKSQQPAPTESGGKGKKRRNTQFEVYVGRTYERHDTLFGGKVHIYKHLAFTGGVARAGDDIPLATVSYTHLTLPTKRIV